jgi:hypothetical protein
MILLNRKRLEASLPDPPGRPITPVMSANVRGKQPVHPAAQIAVAAWPQHEMKVVWHQAPSEYAHRNALARKSDQLHEGPMVDLVVKHDILVIPAVDHVVAVSP